MDQAVAKRIGALVPRIEAIQKKDWKCATPEESAAELLAQLFKHTCSVQQLEKFITELESRKAACKSGYPLYVREFCENAVKGGVSVSDGKVVRSDRHRFVVHLDRPLLLVLDKFIATPHGCKCVGHGYFLKRRGRVHRQVVCGCPCGQEVQRYLDRHNGGAERPLLKLMKQDHTEFPAIDGRGKKRSHG